MDTRHKTISTKSAEIIKHFTDLNKPAFTILEAQAFLKNASDNTVTKLIRDMATRGLLLKLKDSIYWIIPYDQDAATYFPNWHLIAQYLVGDAGYYIGYYSALEIHSLITQPALSEQIVVNKQIKPSTLKIKNIKFQFIYHNEEHFFGSANNWIDNFNKVACSDLEKTFVDCLYKPDYGGGITEIAKALYKVKDKIDYPKLYNYCIKFNAQAVIKRLGFLLELLKIDTPILDQLQLAKTKAFTQLEPSYEAKGPFVSKWSIQQNIETADITSPIFS